MNKYYSNTKGQSIIAIDHDTFLGSVYDLAINPEDGSITAILVNPLFSFSKKKVLLPQDIMKWTSNIYVYDHESITDIEDIVRLNSLFDNYINLIDLPVFTESGEKIGIILNFLISDVEMKVKKIIVGKKALFGFYIEEIARISSKDIILIEEAKVIVSDTKIKEEKSAYDLAAIAE